MSDERREAATFLGRLARDTRGNTLAIVGASLVPLIAMIGSGIDMSRGYMAQTRLQQACDAAALAGRRAMTDGTVDATVRAEANKFFNFNFPVGTANVAGTAAFGSTGFTPTIGSGANTTVTVSASTVVPTSLMKMFGYVSLPISVNCKAKLDFVNTDIVLVLDTTGSMAAKADAADADTKIVAMRKAVLSFYDVMKPIQTQLEGVNLRLRYAVVPYASSINMGKVLRGVDTSYVVGDSWTYQGREPFWRHQKTGQTKNWCDNKGGSTSNQSGSGSSATYTCTWYDLTSTGDNASFWGWNYKPMTYDVSSYVAGSTVNVPNRAPSSSAQATWAGCIEERQTSSTLTGTSTSIPAAAKDLDIDLVPTSDRTSKWKPYWPEVVYERYNDTLNKSNVGSDYWYLLDNDDLRRPQTACPAQARRLAVWTKSDLSTYLDTLNPDGGTYHDNGMVWGIRMLSGTGVFSADNPSTYGGMPVSKYLIFMTDGAFDTGYETLYTTYGIERWDQRVGASDEDDQLARHVNRFSLLCTAAKARGISVWVVAFDQALTDSLTKCATNKNQASTSSNQTQLNARFVEIGQNIGALRLTQ